MPAPIKKSRVPLQALDAFDGDNFLILFKDDKGPKFTRLYVLFADGKEVLVLGFSFICFLVRVCCGPAIRRRDAGSALEIWRSAASLD